MLSLISNCPPEGPIVKEVRVVGTLRDISKRIVVERLLTAAAVPGFATRRASSVVRPRPSYRIRVCAKVGRKRKKVPHPGLASLLPPAAHFARPTRPKSAARARLLVSTILELRLALRGLRGGYALPFGWKAALILATISFRF